MGVYDGLIDINLLERFWNNAKQHLPSGGGGDVPLFDDYDTNIWTIGTFSSANGTVATSTTRMRTEILSKAVKKVRPAAGYKAAFWVYDASGTYQGVWNGTAAVKSVVVWFTDTVDFSAMPSGSQVRILAANTSDSTITTSTLDTFAQGIILTRYTDDSLSHGGYPADAKVVGEALYKAKNRKYHTPAALTYWDATVAYSSGGITAANVPTNSYTEAEGSYFSFSGLTLKSSYQYVLICLVSYHNAAVRYYFLFSRTLKEFYMGRTASSGSSVDWTNWSPSGAKTDSITTTTTWSGNGPYTQTVTLTNGSPTSNSKIDIQPDAAAIAQLMADGVKALYIENNTGTLTAYAIGAAPTAALTLQVTVTEVTA